MRFTIDQIKNTIVEDFNELQLTDSYFFADSETDILWIDKHDLYFVLKKDHTWKSLRTRRSYRRIRRSYKKRSARIYERFTRS